MHGVAPLLLLVAAAAPEREPPPPPPLLEDATAEPTIEPALERSPPRDERALDDDEPREQAPLVDGSAGGPLGPIETAGVQALVGVGVLTASVATTSAVVAGIFLCGSSCGNAAAPLGCIAGMTLCALTPAAVAFSEVSIGNWLGQRDKLWLLPLASTYGASLVGVGLLFAGVVVAGIVAAAFSASSWPAFFVLAGAATIAFVGVAAVPVAVYFLVPDDAPSPSSDVHDWSPFCPRPAERPLLF